MCRWIVYFGQPIVLADVLVRPKHGLLGMSQHAGALLPYLRNSENFCPEQQRKRNHTLNGDGFGVGFYQSHVTVPGVFKSIGPAWNSYNLRSISTVISSDHIFAHVRAATEVLSISQQNCHPFQAGQFMFMHNGGIMGFKEIKRPLLWLLPDAIYSLIQGSTDSEHLFMLFLCYMSKLKGGSVDFTRMQVTAQEMALALCQMIEKVIQLCKDANVYLASSFNIAVSCTHATVCTRFRNNPKEDPPSLYLALGSQWSHKWYDEPIPIIPTPVVGRERSASTEITATQTTHTQTVTVSGGGGSELIKEKQETEKSEKSETQEKSKLEKSSSRSSIQTTSPQATTTSPKAKTKPLSPTGCLKGSKKPKKKKDCAIVAAVQKCVKFYTVATVLQGEASPEASKRELPKETTSKKGRKVKVKEQDLGLTDEASPVRTSTSTPALASSTSSTPEKTPQLRRVASAPDINLLCGASLCEEMRKLQKSCSEETPSTQSTATSTPAPSKDDHFHSLSCTVVISSEPVNESLEQWNLIPKDHIAIMSREGPGEPVKVDTYHMSRFMSPESFDCTESDKPRPKGKHSKEAMEEKDSEIGSRFESKKSMKKLLTNIFHFLDSNRDGYVAKHHLLEFVNQLIPESEDPWFAAELLEIADFTEHGISLRNWLCFFTKLFFHGRYTLKHLRKMSRVFPVSCETPFGMPSGVPQTPAGFYSHTPKHPHFNPFPQTPTHTQSIFSSPVGPSSRTLSSSVKLTPLAPVPSPPSIISPPTPGSPTSPPTITATSVVTATTITAATTTILPTSSPTAATTVAAATTTTVQSVVSCAPRSSLTQISRFVSQSLQV